MSIPKSTKKSTMTQKKPSTRKKTTTTSRQPTASKSSKNIDQKVDEAIQTVESFSEDQQEEKGTKVSRASKNAGTEREKKSMPTVIVHSASGTKEEMIENNAVQTESSYSNKIENRAWNLVKHYSLRTFVLSLIPIPLFTLIALPYAHLKMLYKISDLYDFNYEEQKNFVYFASVFATAFPVAMYDSFFTSLIDWFPLIGSTLAFFLVPLTSAICTYVIGQVFILHFSLGGTLLYFKASRIRKYIWQHHRNE